MSIRVAAEVWELDLPLHLKAVLLILADHAHDDGTKSFPGKSRIAWKTQKEEETVKRNLKELRKLGLIEPTAHFAGGRGNATEYRVVPSAGTRLSFEEWLARKGDADVPLTEAKRGTLTPVKGDTERAERGTLTPVKGDADDPPTIINHQGNHPQEMRRRCGDDLGAFGWAECPVPVHCWLHEGTEGWEQLATMTRSVRDPAGWVRDPLFEAVALVTGLDPLVEGVPKPEEGRLRAAVRDLRAIDAKVADVIERAVTYVRRWPEMEFTPTALAANWSRVRVPKEGRGPETRIADAIVRFSKAARRGGRHPAPPS